MVYVYVCVCVRERESVCVCVCLVCVCVCVCRLCVCVCVYICGHVQREAGETSSFFVHFINVILFCISAVTCKGRPEKRVEESRLNLVANIAYLSLGWCAVRTRYLSHTHILSVRE